MNPGAEREVAWRREGFVPWPAAGRFVPALVRIFYREAGEGLVFRAVVGPEHCNGHGIAHGGFLATLADIWLGYNLARRLPAEARFATANLGVDYLRPVAPGACLESVIDRVRTGSRLCHAAGAIVAAGESVAAMRGTFCRLG